MHILLVVTNSDYSGAPRNVLDIAEALQGYATVSLFAGGDGHIFAPRRDLFREVLINKNLKSDFSILRTLRSFSSLTRFARHHDIGVIWCHSFKAALIGRLVGWLLGKRVIYTVHGWPWRGFGSLKSHLIEALERLVTRVSNPTLVFLSSTERQNSPKWAINFPYFILPNTTHLGDLGVTPPPRNGRVVMIARVDRSKDHNFLFEVCSRSRFIRHLELVGSGTEAFDGMVLGNGCLVTSVGAVPDVVEKIRGADLVVLFSRFEALPISLIEALSQARPIVASDVGSVSELVVDGFNGFLTSGDVSAAAANIDTLLGDDDCAGIFGSRSRALFVETYSRAAFRVNVVDLVRAVAAQPHRNR